MLGGWLQPARRLDRGCATHCDLVAHVFRGPIELFGHDLHYSRYGSPSGSHLPQSPTVTNQVQIVKADLSSIVTTQHCIHTECKFLQSTATVDAAAVPQWLEAACSHYNSVITACKQPTKVTHMRSAFKSGVKWDMWHKAQRAKGFETTLGGGVHSGTPIECA